MRRGFAGALCVPLVLVAACSPGTAGDAYTPPAPTAATASSPSSRPTPGAGEASPSGTQTGDDLATGRARHVIRSGGVTTSIDYQTPEPDLPWTASGEKPLRVEVKVSRPKKKVYLNRVTLRFSSSDGSGDVPGPDPVVDSATNISPGYLVAPPYSYVQSFAVPVVDPASVSLTIDVKVELVSLVDKKAKDYTKTTVTDRVTTAIG